MIKCTKCGCPCHCDASCMCECVGCQHEELENQDEETSSE